MGKSKYEGGSKITTFRLPLKYFQEAKKGIEMYLERFQSKGDPDSIPEQALRKQHEIWKEQPEIIIPENFMDKALKMVAVDPKIETVGDRLVSMEDKTNRDELRIIHKEAFLKKEMIEKAVEKDGKVYYPCGCYFGPDMFHRVPNCRIGYSDAHKEKYGI